MRFIMTWRALSISPYQVIVREVGEHRHVEVGAVHSPLRQRVARHLHRRSRRAVVQHTRQLGTDG